MPNVDIHIIGLLTELVGKTNLNVRTREGATLSDVLAEVGKEYGEDVKNKILSSSGDFHPYIIASVNGIDVRERGGVTTPVKEGDKISVALVVVGG